MLASIFIRSNKAQVFTGMGNVTLSSNYVAQEDE